MGLSRLTRYLLREVMLAWAAVTIVLVVVLLTNRLVQFMADAARGDIPPDVIFLMLGLKAAANLSVVLPGSFFLGVVLALGRLYRDSEMSAMAGCGVSPFHVYRGIFALAIPLAIAVGALSLSVGPAAERQSDVVRANAQQEARFLGVQAGQFTRLGSDATVYVAAVDEGGGMDAIFAERKTPDGREILVANGGRRVIDGLGSGEFLVVKEGFRYRGVPGEGAWEIMRYAEHGVRISEPSPVQPGIGRDAVPLQLLLLDRSLVHNAELQWRLSLPFMIVVLALTALPLAKTDPRSGRYGRVVVAVILFMIYFNLLYAAQDWMIAGATPAWLGLYWVHAVAIGLALLFLQRRFQVIRQRATR
ncbi:LPS export ABC transporter permease LptF [Spiribacter sp. C176]|uniref:Lipopolysaccharide export system permease protein LptF n=1 Tax=Spiribacter salilacus TaxID=2664894 RepID=A0A6N7QU06_9GAMM|nr:LPS export ABC transporter permease LptF [Spiribacter salilacus]